MEWTLHLCCELNRETRQNVVGVSRLAEDDALKLADLDPVEKFVKVCAQEVGVEGVNQSREGFDVARVDDVVVHEGRQSSMRRPENRVSDPI